MKRFSYFVGLDLGQAQDYSALAVLQRRWVPPGAPSDQRRPPYALRYLKRYPLGTAYPEVFASVRTVLQAPALRGALLVVDQTGVGKAVVDMLHDTLLHQVDALFCPVLLTAGVGSGQSETGFMEIAKKELVGVLQVLLQTQRLQLARSLPDVPLLVKELENFRAKVSLVKTDPLESWREGQHDDLVFAVGLAAWAGEQGLPALHDPVEDVSFHRLVLY